jgi:hypothetical protein
MLAEARGRLALLASALFHAAFVLVTAFAGRTLALRRDALDRPDRWGGDTFEIDGLVARPASPAAPAAQPAPAAPEAPATPATPEPASPAVPPEAAREPVERAPSEPKPAAARAPKKPAAAELVAHAPPAAPPAASESSSAPAPAPDGTFGAAGLEPGVRNLAKAFTRALPVGGRADATWFRLPVGAAGAARLTITIDEEGVIQKVDPLPIERGERVPAHLERLFDRVILLLRAGRFALDQSDRTSGGETLRVEAEVREGGPRDEYAEPQHTIDMGFEPPTRGRAGKAWFTYASGRRVELRVKME